MHLLCSKEMKGTAATSNQLWSFYENNSDSRHVSTVSTAGSSPKQPFTGTFTLPNQVPILGYLLLPRDLPRETSGWGLEFARHWLVKRSISIADATSTLVNSIYCHAHEHTNQATSWSEQRLSGDRHSWRHQGVLPCSGHTTTQRAKMEKQVLQNSCPSICQEGPQWKLLSNNTLHFNIWIVLSVALWRKGKHGHTHTHTQSNCGLPSVNSWTF